MAKRAEKLSVTVPGDVASEVRQRVGSRGVSAYVTIALKDKLRRERERERLRTFLDELEEILGPADPDEVAAVVAELEDVWRDT